MKVAIVQDLYSLMVNINLRTDFELLEVKVSLIFLGTVGFSARRDGRYSTKVPPSSLNHHQNSQVALFRVLESYRNAEKSSSALWRALRAAFIHRRTLIGNSTQSDTDPG